MKNYIDLYKGGNTIYELIRDCGLSAEDAEKLVLEISHEDVLAHKQALAGRIETLLKTLPANAVAKKTGASIGTVNRIIKERKVENAL